MFDLKQCGPDQNISLSMGNSSLCHLLWLRWLFPRVSPRYISVDTHTFVKPCIHTIRPHHTRPNNNNNIHPHNLPHRPFLRSPHRSFPHPPSPHRSRPPFPHRHVPHTIFAISFACMSNVVKTFPCPFPQCPKQGEPYKHITNLKQHIAVILMRDGDVNHPLDHSLWTTPYVKSLLLIQRRPRTPEERRLARKRRNQRYRERHAEELKQRRDRPFMALALEPNCNSSLSTETDVNS